MLFRSVKYRQTLSVEEKLAIIMQQIPRDYKSFVTAAIRSAELSTEQSSVSMEELSQTLVAHYWALQFNRTEKSEGKEFSAFAGDTNLQLLQEERAYRQRLS